MERIDLVIGQVMDFNIMILSYLCLGWCCWLRNSLLNLKKVKTFITQIDLTEKLNG